MAYMLLSSCFLLQMMMSSTQAKADSQSLIARSMCRWQDATVFLRPQGILISLKRTKGLVRVVFCTSSRLTGI